MHPVTQYTLPEFLQLPVDKVAEAIRGLTVALPIDGTRRWFLTHYKPTEDVEEYKQLVGARYLQVYQMLFDHGVETLLIPVFGGELVSRGEMYVREMMEGMTRLVRLPSYQAFYQEYNVRVHFYGDWRRRTHGLPGADDLAAAFDGCDASHYTGSRRLFYGVWGDDLLSAIVDDMARSKTEPVEFTNQAIISRYYGEPVNPTDLYIGFGPPCVYDVPMLVTPQTSLYFMVAPSLDIDARLFRMMVWDHFAGRWNQQEWDDLTADDLQAMRAFYSAHHDCVQGLGEVDARSGIWYPRDIRSLDSFRQAG